MIADLPTPPALIRIHNPITSAAGFTTSIPRAPKGCKATRGHLTPWAKRHGFTLMVTWTCRESARLGQYEVGAA